MTITYAANLESAETIDQIVGRNLTVLINMMPGDGSEEKATALANKAGVRSCDLVAWAAGRERAGTIALKNVGAAMGKGLSYFFDGKGPPIGYGY
ncbi:MAG TPA: hypothetical protein VGP13_01130 [Candidatus Paceibacterota bacterium]|jgi:hypothetical protein|nr:hypothetical protein [Candidatus Paceibacterota bacterium]